MNKKIIIGLALFLSIALISIPNVKALDCLPDCEGDCANKCYTGFCWDTPECLGLASCYECAITWCVSEGCEGMHCCDPQCALGYCGSECADNYDCSDKCNGTKWYSSYSCNSNCSANMSIGCTCNLDNLICSMGSCNATCDSDDDCSTNYKCNSTTCSCYYDDNESSTTIQMYPTNDAAVKNSNPTYNYGINSYVECENWYGQIRYGYSKWFIKQPDVLPYNINITNAIICIFNTAIFTSGYAELHDVFNQTWLEGSGNANPSGDGITWNDQPCGTSLWNESLCNSTIEASYNFLANTETCLDITNLVKKVYERGYDNLTEIHISSSNDGVMFRSKEYSADFYMNITYGNIPTYNVTFNILDNETFAGIKNITISCNNSYSGSGFDSPFNHSFQNGFYNCSFLNTSYYPNSSVFQVNDSSLNLTITIVRIPLNYNITFNVLNISSGHLSNVTISCNNSYNETNKSSPFIHSFTEGTYSCNFTSNSAFNTTEINVDATKNITVYLQVMNFIFYVRDSFTETDLADVLLLCSSIYENFSLSIDSPYTRVFIYFADYDCNVSKTSYYNFSFSFDTSIYDSALIYMDRIGGLTQEEKARLDQIYFLQSVEALPEELIIQSQTCLDENILLTSYNPIYCQSPATCQNVTTTCQWGCDPVNEQCRANPIETGAFFICLILYMIAIIVIPILIITHHSKKRKRDFIIHSFVFLFAFMIYVITSAFIIPAIASFFGNDYYFTIILVGLTLIFFPMIDVILIINNIIKDRY